MKAIIPFDRSRRCRMYLLLLAGLILGRAANAQNAGNVGTRTYDTALTSDGFGIYHLRIPQFNPDSGTLVSVHISALTNTMYGFTLRNADSLAETYTLTVGLQDEFSGPALPATYSNVTSQALGSFPLNAGQEVTQAPVSLLQNHVSTDTISTIASFLGTGLVNLQYQAFTFTNLNAANHASYYYSAGITNSMTFSVQYLYNKNSGVLNTDLTNWSAVPVGPRNVQLGWTATDEMAGRQYVIQRSSDQNNFDDIATIPATADRNTAEYHFPDELPESGDHNAGSSWYYRLQIRESTGLVQYSPLRVVRFDGEAKGVQVYPNPATTFINLVPDGQEATDWQVDIVSAAGVVVQRNVYMASRLMTVNFQNKLASGSYFVRATDLKGKQSVSAAFIVP
ncbi:MAG TPA: T9SS type A sorting domain-containing protein [Puia sp.]|nr:T9SS type A sorting domain-containing protein [Puia sp.]